MSGTHHGAREQGWDGSEESEREVARGPSERESCEDNQSEHGDEEEEVYTFFVLQRRSIATGFASLDVVDLDQVFEVRALVMKSVSRFTKAAGRQALKISLEEIKRGQLATKGSPREGGWKNHRQTFTFRRVLQRIL